MSGPLLAAHSACPCRAGGCRPSVLVPLCCAALPVSYTSTCSKLIAQYKTLRESLGDAAPSLDSFCRDYGLESRAAVNRLTVGVPATLLHGAGGGGGGAAGAAGGAGGAGAAAAGNKELAIFHAVQHFITVMSVKRKKQAGGARQRSRRSPGRRARVIVAERRT